MATEPHCSAAVQKREGERDGVREEKETQRKCAKARERERERENKGETELQS